MKKRVIQNPNEFDSFGCDLSLI
ncbi:protein of unknown function [Magnetospirillum sp. XM-1]|nr:protein of unknown function [Magnetospirillum sp. XM-1]